MTNNQNTNCIFCKIIKGDIPSYKVYEDNDFLAFLDINPLNKGHTLVIPKEHYRWVWDIPEEKIGNYYKVCKKIANAQKKAFNTEMIASIVLGEEVPHAHIWLVPRFENDGHNDNLNFNNKKKFTTEEMQNFANQIKNNI